jgi:flagellar biosynthesis protein FlhA
MDRITGLRRNVEEDYGVGFPAVRITNGGGLGALDYEIRLFGARFGFGEIHPDRVLAILGAGQAPKLSGIETTDPAYGLPALWVEQPQVEQARAAGMKVIDPATVLITHFADIVQSELATLVTRIVVMRMLDDVRSRQPGLVEELIPTNLSVSDVQRVLQNLLGEGVSIANLDLILEHLADLSRTQRDPGELTELVRQRMSYSICHQLRGRHRDLAVLSLDPRLENQITTSLAGAAAGGMLPIEPKIAEQLIRRLSGMSDAMHKGGRSSVLLCGADIRRQLKAFTRRTIPRLAVLSVNEVPMRINLVSYDIVRLDDERPRQLPADAPRAA